MSGCALNWRAFSLLAATAGCALCAAACGGRHRAAGSEERVLNIYNWADYIGHDTIAEFERRTHIKVVYEFYDSNQTLEAKLLAGSKLPNWKNLCTFWYTNEYYPETGAFVWDTRIASLSFRHCRRDED